MYFTITGSYALTSMTGGYSWHHRRVVESEFEGIIFS